MKNKKFKAFLSHIHEERDYAISLKRELEKLYIGAIEVFVSSDEGSIAGGDRWLQVIENELSGSDVVLILASPESIKRPWVNFEAGAGWFLHKRVIPLCISGLRPSTLPEPLHSLQARNLHEREDFEKLIQDISKNAELMTPQIDFDLLHNKIFSSLSELAPSSPESMNTEEIQELENKSELPLLIDSPTVFFSNRIADAFPGVRGLTWFNNPKEALERLLILLRNPLRFKYRQGEAVPIWWWRGGSNNYIENFRALTSTKGLMDIHELEISRVAVYRSESYFRHFVYIETKPEPTTGVYEHRENYIDEQMQQWGYASEEYGLLNDTPITRMEYDDGSAVIDEKVVDALAAELRVRYLSRYNFIIASHSSPINSQEFDDICEDFLNGILTGEQDINILIEKARKLPIVRDEYD